MEIVFNVAYDKTRDMWVATAYQRPTVKGQPPVAVLSALGEDPVEALRSCVDKLEDE